MNDLFVGKSIYKGIAIGKIHFYGKKSSTVKRGKISEIRDEINRYENAKQITISQIDKLYEKAVKEVGEINAQIFEIHKMMIEDDDYNDSVRNIIESQSVNAEYAVAKTAENFSAIFENMEDDYFKARAIDVKDISERIIAVLTNSSTEAQISEPCIIMAEELTPSETVQMEKSFLLGFVTRIGSVNSHTAILARTMNIPAVSDIIIDESYHGKMAIVDGIKGKVIIEPDDKTIGVYQNKLQEELEKKELLSKYKGKETINKNGKKIRLYANIGGISDVSEVLKNDAEGIGLLRSEFLYLQESDYPTEEEQFQAYKKVAELMVNKNVIIRTMDIGADKKVDYFNLDKEENPALGYRAIRICLEEEHIFKTQLRAIYRASAYGNISIMFPMITSLWEIREIKKIIEQIKQEFDEVGIKYGNVQLGVMIETPAAVMISDYLAKEVDFFSIGTNDLTQYTLAIDRQNTKLDRFYNPHHEAVLRMIQLTVENAHREGIWVGICGELASDMSLVNTFMEMGVDELSVSPSMILAIRKEIIDKK